MRVRMVLVISTLTLAFATSAMAQYVRVEPMGENSTMGGRGHTKWRVWFDESNYEDFDLGVISAPQARAYAEQEAGELAERYWARKQARESSRPEPKKLPEPPREPKNPKGGPGYYPIPDA